MQAHKPTGWNTWDYRGFNRLVYLQAGRARVAVQYAIWDETYRPEDDSSRERGALHDSFRWSDVRHLGPHAPLGLPAVLQFDVGGVTWQAEAVAEASNLECTVRPLSATALRAVFMLILPDNQHLAVKDERRGRFGDWVIEIDGANWPREYFLNLHVPFAVAVPGTAAMIRVSSRRSAAVAVPDSASALDTYRGAALRGGGALEDAPEAMTRAVNWNSLFDGRRGLVSSPVCRDWCIDWRGPIIFGWDSFFAALMASAESRELARFNVEAALAGVDQLGFVPNYFMSHGAASLDRSMPCLGAYAAWKIEQADPDTVWLGRMYRRLRKWHKFWMANRDGRRDGLLSWGSNPAPAYQFTALLGFNPSLQHTAKCAMYEAGLDNSPVYDDVPFNKQANTFEVADIMLNSYYALDCEALAAIADTLGQARQAQAYRREYAAVKERINTFLWDDDRGIYANRAWDGAFSDRWSPSSFFPLLAGIPTEAQAARLVGEHLLNEQEFWGPYVLPSISRHDPAYADNDYWRGRIWGPFNYLVAEGLRRYRFDGAAADLAKRGVDMFLRNWRDDGGVYENYNAETGDGADVWNAARLYHWGGLLALIALNELVDGEPSGVLRLGSLSFPDASVKGYQLAGARFDVELGDGLRVARDGASYLDCTTRAIVRIPSRAEAAMPIEITSTAAGRLVLYAAAHPARTARLNGTELIEPDVGSGNSVYEWNTPRPSRD